MRKSHDANCDKADNRLKARWERMSQTNERIGRRRGDYAARAQRKRVIDVANQLAKESDWRGDLARSVKEIIDIDDCNQVYEEHSR